MRELSEIKADLYATKEEHCLTTSEGHRHVIRPDTAVRFAAVKELGSIVDSVNRSKLNAIIALLAEHIRDRTFSRPFSDRPSKELVVREFSLTRATDKPGRQSRTRSALHRLRCRLFEACPLPEESVAQALRILQTRRIQLVLTPAPQPINLDLAILRVADLREANLSGISLKSADLAGASLFRADLSKSNLDGAALWGAELGFGSFVRSSLRNASLSLADLMEANFDQAVLESAHLDFAYVGQASLVGANLQSANMECANLSAADLSDVSGLTRVQLSEAFGCADTVLPFEFANWRPAHWYPGVIPTHRRRQTLHYEWLAHRERGSEPPWLRAN